MGAKLIYEWAKGDGGPKNTYQNDYEKWKNGGLWNEVTRLFPEKEMPSY